MPQSLASAYLHIVFSTKDRALLIRSGFQDDLYGYIGSILRNRDCVLLSSGGTLDHVHLLVSLSRQASIADVLRDIKSISSKWIHETQPDLTTFEWQRGYGVFSIRYSGVGKLSDYIRNQAEHHRVKTFKEELIELLKEHDLDYDERYLWD
jgi:REP element-mobilizing transposase RayT